MRVIRFELEGILNSFRVPFFKTYHKSFLTPPKSTIIGLLCNISLKNQKDFFELLNSDFIKVSVILKDLQGKAKDLWTYKLYEKKNFGKSVIRRDKLHLAKYIIYLEIEDKDLAEEILENLKEPKNTPALGLDDEIVKISNIKIVELENNSSNIVHSTLLTKNPKISDISQIDNNLHLEMPTFYKIPTKFEAFDKKGKRKSKQPKEELLQVEFFNCSIEVSNIKSYYDAEYNMGVIFS